MISKFLDLGIAENVAKAIDEMGWEEPSPIQEAAIPAGLKGYDLIAQAQTGTGKTGTFGSVILSTIPSGQKVPSAIVLEPTRELAVQVSEELGKMSDFSGHVCVPIYGGASIERQVDELEEGVDIIAGTPGRVKDMIEREYLDLSRIKVIVMDESDRMLDMGFIDDIEFSTI